MESIASFVQKALENGALEKNSNLFNTQFKLWTQKDPMKGILANLKEDKEDQFETLRSRDLSLHLRAGMPLSLGHLSNKKLTPVRAAKANSINSRLSSEFSIDRMKKHFLSKNGIERRIVAADSRGRMILAEARSNDINSSEVSSLLFCAALPLVNTRHVSKPVETHLEKGQLCLAGTQDVDFSVVGMSLCKDYDNHLAVWGTSKVSVFIVSKSCDCALARIDMITDLDPSECETDYILKGEWMLTSSGVSVYPNYCTEHYCILISKNHISFHLYHRI
jgi:hypothetical protein